MCDFGEGQVERFLLEQQQSTDTTGAQGDDDSHSFATLDLLRSILAAFDAHGTDGFEGIHNDQPQIRVYLFLLLVRRVRHRHLDQPDGVHCPQCRRLDDGHLADNGGCLLRLPVQLHNGRPVLRHLLRHHGHRQLLPHDDLVAGLGLPGRTSALLPALRKVLLPAVSQVPEGDACVRGATGECDPATDNVRALAVDWIIWGIGGVECGRCVLLAWTATAEFAGFQVVREFAPVRGVRESVQEQVLVREEFHGEWCCLLWSLL